MVSFDRRGLLGALALAVACTGTMGEGEMDAARDAGRSAEDASAGDASTEDASAGDAATGDSGAGEETDGGPAHSASCPPHAILCESFEEGPSLDPTRWRVEGAASTFVLDAEHAADGSRSLHMRYGRPHGALGDQAFVTRSGIAAPEDRVYVRAYLRFEELSLPGAHPFFITAYDGDAWLAFGSISNDFALMSVGNGLDAPQMWFEHGSWRPGVEDGDDTPLTEHHLRAGDWICVELTAFGGGADPDTEESSVAIDGVPIPEMVANDERWGFPAAERWSPQLDGTPWAFGLNSFGPDEVALDIWFDAIVISNEPIGCLPR